MRSMCLHRGAKARSAIGIVGAELLVFLLFLPAPSAAGADGLVHIHVSAELLQREALQSVERDLVVRDVILGVPVQGKARLKAATSLKLLDGQEKGVFEIVLTGSAVSATSANAGQATIHSRTTTRFTARKQIVLDREGLHPQPATCRAVATSTITGVASSLPRLRGRIARRVAWRRAQLQRAQAELISARHSEQSIGRDFDADIARDVRQANAWLASRLKSLPAAGGEPQPRFRTSSEGLKVTELTGSLTDLAAVQDSLREIDVAVGLRFDNDHLVLTVGLPRTKADAGGNLAESDWPTILPAANLLKLAPRQP
ncbi:MAG TPA: hypothetical protein VND64_20145 [Pirellulales bacterium]|nr:hypothetical protein [Pirellulales bacterium]